MSRLFSMMVPLLALLVALCCARPADAQCTQFGPLCAGGTSMACRTPPQIGTNFTLCQVSLSGVACRQTLWMFGACDRIGTPIAPPIACNTCPSCSLWLNPVLVSVVTSAANAPCLTVPIPRDPNLVGATLCAQGACVSNACLCLSSAQQIVVMP